MASASRFRPATLGDHNSESVFAAVKFEPSDNFNAVYKFDWSGNDYTPEGNAAIVIQSRTNDGNGRILSLLIEQSGRRRCHDWGIHRSDHPARRGSGFCPRRPAHRFCDQRLDRSRQSALQRPQPDREWHATDNFSAKDIFAYRQSYLYGASALTGMSGMVITPAAAAAIQADTIGLITAANKTAYANAVGNRYHRFRHPAPLQERAVERRTPAKLQLDLMEATPGAIYFKSKEHEGGPQTMFASKNCIIADSRQHRTDPAGGRHAADRREYLPGSDFLQSGPILRRLRTGRIPCHAD